MAVAISPVICSRNEKDFRNVIKYNFASGNGAQIVFEGGTTGEYYVQSVSERRNSMGIAADEVAKLRREDKSKLRLAVGITGRNLTETLALAYGAGEVKADYAVFMPLWITQTQDGEFSRDVEGVAEVLKELKGLPLILYNHPGMTGGKNIHTVDWKRLAQDGRITGLKDSSGDRRRLKNYLAASRGEGVYVGDEGLGLGDPGNGVVAGSLNILPVQWARAILRDTGEDIVGGFAADKLAGFRKVYVQNPIGAFHWILKEFGVIGDARPLDEKNTVSHELEENLAKLVSDEDFQRMRDACLRDFVFA